MGSSIDTDDVAVIFPSYQSSICEELGHRLSLPISFGSEPAVVVGLIPPQCSPSFFMNILTGFPVFQEQSFSSLRNIAPVSSQAH